MRLPVHIWIREENARPEEIAGYFIELARRLDAKPQRMRLVMESAVPVSLDFDPSDGNPAVSVGGGACRFDIRRRWIPEHPVPLQLGPVPTGEGPVPTGEGSVPTRQGRTVLLTGEGSVPTRQGRTVLLIDPVDGNRFRVRDRREVTYPDGWIYALFVLAAVAAAVTLHPAAIASTALLALPLVAKWLLKWRGK